MECHGHTASSVCQRHPRHGKENEKAGQEMSLTRLFGGQRPAINADRAGAVKCNSGRGCLKFGADVSRKCWVSLNLPI